jgi:EpsD family peptidyl-prolyl cis-trans isomerase
VGAAARARAIGGDDDQGVVLTKSVAACWHAPAFVHGEMKMTKFSKMALVAGVAAAALVAGCNKKGELPKGQVVATVDGTDVTVHELNSEIQLAQAPANVPRKTIEQAALQRIVERKMLSDVAKKQNLDKNPNFILAEQRANEGLLVQALQASIAAKVPQVTAAEAEKYVANNPAQFAERKVYIIDQIQFLRPDNIASIGLGPAKTMADVVRALTAANVEFRRAPTSIDTLTVAPALTQEISKITARDPHEVFMFADQPRGAPAPVMYVNEITEVQSNPFVGPKAVELAQRQLQQQAVQKALVEALKKFQAEEKGKIVYAEGYGPPAPGAKPAEGTKAAAAAAATAPQGAVVTAPQAPVAAATPSANTAPAAPSQ